MVHFKKVLGLGVLALAVTSMQSFAGNFKAVDLKDPIEKAACEAAEEALIKELQEQVAYNTSYSYGINEKGEKVSLLAECQISRAGSHLAVLPMVQRTHFTAEGAFTAKISNSFFVVAEKNGVSKAVPYTFLREQDKAGSKKIE